MKPNIAEIRKMLTSVSPRPWIVELGSGDELDKIYAESDYVYVAEEVLRRDSEFIAKAPETISALCDEVERQAEEIEALMEENIRIHDDNDDVLERSMKRKHELEQANEEKRTLKYAYDGAQAEIEKLQNGITKALERARWGDAENALYDAIKILEALRRDTPQ